MKKQIKFDISMPSPAQSRRLVLCSPRVAASQIALRLGLPHYASSCKNLNIRAFVYIRCRQGRK